MLDRPVMLLVNPSAGGGRALAALPGVEAAFSARGVVFETCETASLDHAREAAGSAADGGAAVFTLSGDGLVGCVAGVLRHRDDALLGVLPGGRGNDLARVLKIPSDPVAAVGALLDGEVRAFDVGDVDGRTFIGIASFGFDSDANRIANSAPPRLGSLVYVYGALRALLSWKPARFELSLDGGPPILLSGYTVAAANSKAYGGGMYIAPDARLDDGLLDIVVNGHVNRARFLARLPGVFRGAHVRHAEVRVLRAREVLVDADRPFVIYADGDPIGATPATIRAVPGAIRMLVPTRNDL